MKKGFIIFLASFFIALSSPVSFAGAAEPILLKQLNFIPPTIGLSKAVMAWYGELEKRSGGRIKVEHYWNSSLAAPKDIASYTAQNIVQAGQVSPGYNPQQFRLIRIGQIPYLADKLDAQLRPIMEAYRANDALRKEFEDNGLKLIILEGPERGPLPSKKPAYKVEDLKGWKIRDHGVYAPVLKAWGAIPIQMPYPDVPEALDRGVIDSCIGVYFASFYGLKFHELVQYAIDPGERFSSLTLECMSLKFYNSLPKDLQKVVDEMVEEGLTIYCKAYAKEVENVAKLLAPTQMKFIRWSPAEIERGKAMGLPVAMKEFFEEMKKRGVEKEARELYDFIAPRAKKYESQSVFTNAFELVEKYRKERK